MFPHQFVFEVDTVITFCAFLRVFTASNFETNIQAKNNIKTLYPEWMQSKDVVPGDAGLVTKLSWEPTVPSPSVSSNC